MRKIFVLILALCILLTQFGAVPALTVNTYTQLRPEGTGTEDDPFLIESGSHLLWMSAQIVKGSTATFDGVYFKQTQTIDLNGGTIHPIGYYYSETAMAAFGGHYDGQGYAIQNGFICANETIPAAFTREYGYGLFGVIYGAALQNIVLNNITVVGQGVTGTVVGKSAAPTNRNATAAFNLIINCEIKRSCRIITRLPAEETANTADTGYDHINRAGMVGSVCGMIQGTTLRYCTSEVEFSVSGTFTHAGGIAASAGDHSVIDHCTFTGGIYLTDNAATRAVSIGGILGMISPNTSTIPAPSEGVGAVQITNCYNSGALCYTGNSPLSKENHWGGIVGFSGWLYGVSATEELYPYRMENCHNLYAFTTPAIMNNSLRDWVAGLVGKGDAAGGSSQDTLWLKNCSSVAVQVQSLDGIGTNEYQMVPERSMRGYYGIEPVPDSFGNSTVQTRTAAQILPAIQAIHADIAAYRDACSGRSAHRWLSGNGIPEATGAEGNLYLNKDDGGLFLYTNGAWILLINISGEEALTGKGAPTTVAPEGGLYLDEKTGTLYLYTNQWILLSEYSHSYTIPKSNATHHWTECSCGKTTEAITHTHTIPNYDAANHWKECVCGHKADILAHDLEFKYNDISHWNECACGFKINTIIHTMIPLSDKTHHWTACDCGHKTDEIPHTMEPKSNETHHWTECACGYKTAEIPHDHAAPKYDAANHWKECACGHKANVTTHSFTWVVDRKADEDLFGLKHEECTCGAKRNENTRIDKLDHTHTYGLWQQHDAEQHKRICTKDIAHVEYQDHAFENGVCTACGYEIPMPFADVTAADWFYGDVKYAFHHGLMNGITAETFAPNNTTTRAMVVTLLYRLEGEPEVQNPSPFADVTPDLWFYEEVLWAAENGIVEGYGNGLYGPDDEITREQLATILYRYATRCGYDTAPRADLSGYTDKGEIATWAE
ncbi:MAG: S-layer homology domain-containing protein, partial [Clostridia bacterium]|nr:S-layer homology domain-containing protein [Clostridia bacterium]